MPTLASEEEVRKLVQGLGAEDIDLIGRFVRRNGRKFFVEPDSGGKVALTRFLFGVAEGSSIYFLALENGVWPSSEMVDVFYRIRRSEGIHQTLAEVRYEKGGSNDQGYFECLTFCGLSFCWSFAVVFPDIPLIFYADDDEWFGVHSPNKKLLAKIRKELLRMEYVPARKYRAGLYVG